MDSIRSFTWHQYQPNPIQQEAVVNGNASPNFLTYLDCVPGSVYCSFTSILFAEFFAVPLPVGNYVEGNGIAFLRFGTGSEASRRRFLANSTRNGRRHLQGVGGEPEEIGLVIQTEAVDDDGYGELRTADAFDTFWFGGLRLVHLFLIPGLFVNPLILLT